MPRYPPLVAFDELGEHPDLAGRAVVDARPVEPGEQHVRGAHALGVDAVHLGGRELRQLAELLVRHEALEPLAAKPRCKSVEPRPLGLGEESARDVDPHVRPARNRKGSSGVARARAQACPPRVARAW